MPHSAGPPVRAPQRCERIVVLSAVADWMRRRSDRDDARLPVSLHISWRVLGPGEWTRQRKTFQGWKPTEMIRGVVATWTKLDGLARGNPRVRLTSLVRSYLLCHGLEPRSTEGKRLRVLGAGGIEWGTNPVLISYLVDPRLESLVCGASRGSGSIPTACSRAPRSARWGPFRC